MTATQTGLPFGEAPAVPAHYFTAGELRAVAKRIRPLNRSFAQFVLAGTVGFYDEQPVRVGEAARERIASLLALAEEPR